MLWKWVIISWIFTVWAIICVWSWCCWTCLCWSWMSRSPRWFWALSRMLISWMAWSHIFVLILTLEIHNFNWSILADRSVLIRWASYYDCCCCDRGFWEIVGWIRQLDSHYPDGTLAVDCLLWGRDISAPLLAPLPTGLKDDAFPIFDS